MTTPIQVGPRSEKPRSDIRVTLTPSDQPLKIEVQSKVQVLFGDSLLQQARDVCRDLKVDRGHLLLEDFGALPFVVAARLEAAVKQAFPGTTAESLPPFKDHCKGDSERDRFRRSRLYVPGVQPKLMLNAGIHEPDGIILDLEDSVAPSEKDSTRYLVRNALRTVNFFGAERMVRINQGKQGLKDLEFIVPHNVHLILIPKVESASQVQTIDGRITEICDTVKRKTPVFLMPIIESARGVMNAMEIAEASSNSVALAIGLEDYTADLGVSRSQEGRESLFARNIIVNVARATGLQAIDSVYSDVADTEGLKAAGRQSRQLGFDGMGCIHPRQIRTIHEVFAPTGEEITKARKIVLAFDQAREKGLGVVALGSKMIDPPVVQRAQHIIELAIASGLLGKNWKETHGGKD